MIVESLQKLLFTESALILGVVSNFSRHCLTREYLFLNPPLVNPGSATDQLLIVACDIHRL